MRSNSHKIQERIASNLNAPMHEIEIVPLPGDASDRRFYRARLPGGTTRIVMELETPWPEAEDPDRLPYLNILTHLRLCRAPVPKLDFFDPALGILVLEDLGEMTLEEHVSRFGLDSSLALYRTALQELVNMQIMGTRKRCDHCMAFHQSFDVNKLMWELNFFLQHTVEGHLSRNIPSDGSMSIQDAFLNLCRTIAQEPRYFTHRDYHSRNLMVRDGKIGIVDFQDARLGPLQYDLCSLLRDSYVVLPEEIVNELMELYLSERDKLEGTRTDRGSFLRIFDFTSIQRNLKAAGTFGFMAQVKGKENYLKYLPDTFGYVRQNLQKYPELRDLRRALGRVLPEIR